MSESCLETVVAAAAAASDFADVAITLCESGCGLLELGQVQQLN